MIIPTDKPKTSGWFNCVAFLALIAFIFHTLIVFMYLLYFWGIWDTVSSDPGSWYHDGDYPLYFSLWFIEIIILGTWFYYTAKPTPEEDAEFDKLMHIAIENVKQRRGDGKYTALEVKEEIAMLRQRQASNDSTTNSSSSNN